VAGSSGLGNKPSGSTKIRDVLDQLSDSQLLKDSAAWSLLCFCTFFLFTLHMVFHSVVYMVVMDENRSGAWQTD
jgi:hypothetical protein